MTAGDQASPRGIEELVSVSRAAQGLPPKIEDPAVLEQVAALVAAPTQPQAGAA
jgi:hypothetical protein